MSRWVKVLLVVVVVVALLGLAASLVLSLPTFGGAIEGERLARMQRSPQYVDGRFENTPPYRSDLALMQWGLGLHMGTAVSQNAAGDLLDGAEPPCKCAGVPFELFPWALI